MILTGKFLYVIMKMNNFNSKGEKTMRKLFTILMVAAMLLTALSVAASAETYMEKPSCEFEVTVKKADPAVVKKDGVIDLDGGEYVKADVPFEDLAVNFRNAEQYLPADAMAKTMEYYFSWDDTHGFNFAVKYFAKGTVEDVEYDGYYTNIPNGFGAEGSDVPMDNFMCNIGLNFASGVHADNPDWSHLYHAIGKTFDGTYLTGWYQQRGNSGAYSPVGGTDYEVAYPGDGSVIFEWSVPFSEIIKEAPTAGTEFTFTICASAGSDTTEAIITNCWSVSLGQRGGWLVTLTDDNTNAVAILSDEPVKASAPATSETTPDEPVVTTPATSQDVVTTPAPTQSATTEVVTEVVTSQVAVTNEAGETETNEAGEVVTEVVTEVITSIVTEAPTQAPDGNKAPVTGDPVVIAAVVAAISACGVVVAKKRK